MDNRVDLEKIKVYQEMLDKGQIDEATFNSMVNRNINNGEVLLKKARRGNKPYIVAFLVCLFILGIYNYFNNTVDKEYDYINDKQIIDAPIQTEYTGNKTITVRNTPVRVEYVANYEITGRVVSKASYISNGVANEAAKRDVALVWGKLATDEYLEHFTWKSPGNRFVYWKTTDMDWYKAHTSDSEIISMFSNNHLVTTDDEIIKKIENIKKGEYVTIKGYLVNLYWNEGNKDRTWYTSTVRTDDGDGACEIIYVTDIKWLKMA